MRAVGDWPAAPFSVLRSARRARVRDVSGAFVEREKRARMNRPTLYVFERCSGVQVREERLLCMCMRDHGSLERRWDGIVHFLSMHFKQAGGEPAQDECTYSSIVCLCVVGIRHRARRVGSLTASGFRDLSSDSSTFSVWSWSCSSSALLVIVLSAMLVISDQQKWSSSRVKEQCIASSNCWSEG